MLLKEITLQANHLTSLHHFYKEIMDLPVLYSDGLLLKIRAGSSILIFEKNEVIVDPFYHFAFNIPPNKFVEAFDWFNSRLSLLWINDDKSFVADFTSWNAKSFYFYDPAGNIVEMIARFDLDERSEQNYTGASVLNISEIGIVFSSEGFNQQVDKFMEKYSLHFFNKQPPGKNFKVIGSNTGLFIIVPEDRDWSPGIGKKSVNFPLSITFENSAGTFTWNSENKLV